MLVCEGVSDRGASTPPYGLEGDCRETFGWPKETSSHADWKPGVKDHYFSILRREKVPAGEMRTTAGSSAGQPIVTVLWRVGVLVDPTVGQHENGQAAVGRWLRPQEKADYY
jgi:hypothetical protein